jgi:hypothetical protein
MSSWIHDVTRSINRVERIKSGGPAQLSARAQAQIARELCRTYRKLLLDPEFKRYFDSVISNFPASGSFRQHQDELRCHVSEAIALLVEAGVDGRQALDAVRSVETVLANPNGITLLGKKEFYNRLGDAKEVMCNLSDRLWEDVGSENNRFKLRRATLAGVGLVLTGLTGAALAVVAAPAAVAGAVVAGAAVAGAGAISNAIGSTIFQHNANGLREPN